MKHGCSHSGNPFLDSKMPLPDRGAASRVVQWKGLPKLGLAGNAKIDFCTLGYLRKVADRYDALTSDRP